MSVSTDIGVVILAAGSSSRLGHPKQLAMFKNKTLLQHTIDAVSPFNFSPSILVLGAHADKILEDTNLESVSVMLNENWPEGIASGIRLGVSESIRLNKSLESVLFLITDQPFVTSSLIENLVNRHLNGDQGITACQYNGSIGVPAIFRKTYFSQLLELTGDVGAKKIIAKNKKQVNSIIFKDGAIDIDTVEDYKRLLKKRD